jgi:hypothetical protein
VWTGVEPKQKGNAGRFGNSPATAIEKVGGVGMTKGLAEATTGRAAVVGNRDDEPRRAMTRP